MATAYHAHCGAIGGRHIIAYDQIDLRELVVLPVPKTGRRAKSMRTTIAVKSARSL